MQALTNHFKDLQILLHKHLSCCMRQPRNIQAHTVSYKLQRSTSTDTRRALWSVFKPLFHRHLTVLGSGDFPTFQDTSAALSINHCQHKTELYANPNTVDTRLMQLTFSIMNYTQIYTVTSPRINDTIGLTAQRFYGPFSHVKPQNLAK